MKSSALIFGSVVSALLLAAAGGLFILAGNTSGQHYRAPVDLVRQIQELSSSWSIEIARVRSDPLADFDSLAAYIPRMARLKERLLDSSRSIPDLPDRLANDIQVYLSLMAAKEERIERFKTGYAVVRNSARYLPLAARNVTRQAEAAGDEALARRVSTLTQNMNLYLAAPSDASKARLSSDIEKQREDSVAYPASLANAIANLLAHAEVLLARQAPTDLLFQEATSNETGELANRLAGNLDFESARRDTVSTNYERGVLAVIGVLAVFWILLAVHQRGRGTAAAISTAPEVSPAAVVHDEPFRALAARDEYGTRRAPVTIAGEQAAAASSTELNAESAMLYGYRAKRAGDTLTTASERAATGVESLHRTHQNIQRALQSSDLMVELPDGINLDEEVEAIAAIVQLMRREVNGIASLAKRLASFSALANGDAARNLVNVNSCIDEVVAATGVDHAAQVTKQLGDVPDVFASKTEIRLLLAQILENSVRAVEGRGTKEKSIKIDTAQINNEVAITIIDNGVGIPSARHKQIFRPFYTSHDGAMGLGLTLVSHLVKKYEGRIKINSLPSQGTVIRINLPTGTPAP